MSKTTSAPMSGAKIRKKNWKLFCSCYFSNLSIYLVASNLLGYFNKLP